MLKSVLVETVNSIGDAGGRAGGRVFSCIQQTGGFIFKECFIVLHPHCYRVDCSYHFSWWGWEGENFEGVRKTK